MKEEPIGSYSYRKTAKATRKDRERRVKVAERKNLHRGKSCSSDDHALKGCEKSRKGE